MQGLMELNQLHHQATGSMLPSWRGAGELSINAVRAISTINLTPGQVPVPMQLHNDGSIRVGEHQISGSQQLTGSQLLALIGDQTADKRPTTLQQVQDRWLQQAFDDYLAPLQLALFDRSTLQMLQFGKLDKNHVELQLTSRNQPRARIYLNRPL
jgi:hypothetical protein